MKIRCGKYITRKISKNLFNSPYLFPVNVKAADFTLFAVVDVADTESLLKTEYRHLIYIAKVIKNSLRNAEKIWSIWPRRVILDFKNSFKIFRKLF